MVNLVDKSVGNMLFTARNLFNNTTIWAQQLNVIISRIDRFGTVAYHQVAALLLQFDGSTEMPVIGFQREADDPLVAAFALTEDGDDIGCLNKFQGEWFTCFGQLLVGNLEWLVVAGSRSTNGAVALWKDLAGGVEHIVGREDGDDLGARGVINADRAGHDHDVMALLQHGGSKGGTHPATRRIGQISDGIKILSRGTGGDQDLRTSWGFIAHAGLSLDPRESLPLTTAVII